MNPWRKVQSDTADLIGPPGSLRRKTIEGVLWISTGTAFYRLVALVRNVVLARLLVPEDFGLYGASIAVLAALTVFTETGSSSLLIHKGEVDDRYWNTGWVINIARGALLAAVSWVGSDLIAGFYQRPELAPILRLLAVSFLLQGFNNIGLVQLQREMRFKRKVALDQVADLLGNVVAIILGVALRSVWALVVGRVTTSAVLLLLSYAFLTYRPRLAFDRTAARDFLSFGGPLFVLSILVYIITNVDDIAVGRILGMTVLGYYTMAYGLANIPTSHIARTVAQIVFPAYSRVKDEPERLASGFLSVFFYTTMIIVPAAVGIAAVSHDLTVVVLGTKWLPMVPALRILCLLGLFRAVATSTGPLVMGYGRPDYLRNIKLVEFVIFAALIYPAVRYGGLVGVSAFTTGIYGLSLTLHLLCLRRILPGSVRPAVTILALSSLSAALMAAVVLFVRRSVFDASSVTSLITMVIVGVVVYAPLALLLRHRFSSRLAL